MTETMLYRLGESYLDEGRPLDALNVVSPIEAELTRNRAGLLLLGRGYYHSAQLERAQLTFERLVELDPTDAYARFLLGRTLERRSCPVEARTHYRIAAALSDDPEYHDRLALVTDQLERSSAAAAEADVPIEADRAR